MEYGNRMRMITIAALAALSLNAHAVEYTPDTDVTFDIIQMHDTTTWEKVCQTSDSVCDVPEGTYQVKLLDRNWNELIRLRDVRVQHSSSQDSSGGDGVHAPDLTAELCALYQVLDDQSLLGSLSVPTFCSTIYSLGDTGPGGGIVFYVTNGGLRGLEAAPVDQVDAPWCASNVLIGAAGTAIGTGASNTEAILERCPIAGHAAEVASGYNGGGFIDWFLPSRNELHTMWENIGRGCDTNLNPGCDVGGFALGNVYWSSSEFSSQFGSETAWHEFFGDGTEADDGGLMNDAHKAEMDNVRAIRAF